MKKFLAAIIFLLWPAIAVSADFSMKPLHYAPLMEFYYQKPQPEKLFPLLRTMSANHFLDLPENQLMFAAFFASLLQKRAYPGGQFFEECLKLGKSVRHMGAWAFHFARLPESSAMIDRLLDEKDEIIARQISGLPSSLQDWKVEEPAMIPVFWLAFMADGQPVWLNKIIDAAINPPSGNTSAISAKAAASLYEFVGRHPKVLEAVKSRRQKTGAKGREILDTITRHGETANFKTR